MTGHVSRSPLFLLAAALMLGACSPASGSPCFVSGTRLPDRQAVLSAPDLGASARSLMEALFDRDADAVRRLLRTDPALAGVSARKAVDPLTVAVAMCDRGLVDTLLDAGAAPDGPNKEAPLSLAIRATEPWFAARLLEAGASADPVRADFMPLDAAIALNSSGAVRLLLDHGANVNFAGRLGDRPLHAAIDMERYRLAELLLDRGADPWAIDAGGASLGHAVAQPLTRPDAAEDQARQRLQAKVRALGWPDPAPTHREIRALALQGAWPPEAARSAGAPALRPELVEKIRAAAR